MHMVDATSTSNGKGKIPFPTFGCQGCQNRKEIMGAGDWKMDVAILAVIIAIAIFFWRVKIT